MSAPKDESVCVQCGKPLVAVNKDWKVRCAECIRAYKREWYRERKALGLIMWRPTAEQAKAKHARSKHDPEVRKRKAADMARYRNSPEYRQRFDARAQVKNSIKSGTLVRMLCELCGSPNTEAHHDDYSKPLAVRWLCIDHHRAIHKQLRRKNKEVMK